MKSRLPQPPAEYSVEYMNRLVRQLQSMFDDQETIRPIRAASDRASQKFPISAITLIDLPTSATGLPTGSVWNDSGTLKIV